LGRPVGAAGVDQQRQRIVALVGRIHAGRGSPGVELVGLDNRRARVELRPRIGNQHLGAGIRDLVADLRGPQRRVDRFDRRTQAPGREQRRHKAGGVGQHDGHDVAGGYPTATQRRRRALHRGEKLGVVQIGLVIGDGEPEGIDRGAEIRKSG
jgi:hypothetical protein